MIPSALLASLAVISLVTAAEPAVTPLSQRDDVLRATSSALDQAFRMIGTASAMALRAAPSPAHVSASYADGFGQAIAHIPSQMRTEGSFQASQLRASLAELHFDPGVVDAVFDRLDLLGARVLDELQRPDVVLRGFQSYRESGPQGSIMGGGQ